MSNVTDAATALKNAIDELVELKATTDPTTGIHPPVAVIGPPVLTWGPDFVEPMSAEFTVMVIVSNRAYDVEKLWDLVQLVAAKVDEVENAVVIRAMPFVFRSGSSELPAYAVTVEMEL